MSFCRFISLRTCLRTVGAATALSTASVAERVKDDSNTTSAASDKPLSTSAIDAQHEQRQNEIKHQAVTAGVINNPAVSLGLFLTVCALIGMIRKSYTGDRIGAQRFMRYRIMAQFFTLFALIIGVGYFSVKLRKDEEKRVAAAKAAAVSVVH